MKIWGILLIVISLIKTCVFERQDRVMSKVLYQLNHNFVNFQEKLIFFLIFDTIIGLICGLILVTI